ncbi:MAG TPA: adenylate/guanylate cyclase domain-containing protein [Fimbriimonadaceae bacterium]|nr:adenylate/guanylate cyclase domain-containing protein [Fimbriimonadaceae bacterium]HRJ32037.1 adenylate/guanylate cyclase domain-containing protein [Fimbriimonadaceae bacterium]
MDSQQAQPTPGERMLATILFTDVVEYSKLSGQNEERTIMIVRRDLSLMGDLCRKFGGRVVKNTGDGLLMLFASAVQAMQCALEVQKTLYEESQGLPAQEVVRHRIGLHLGDVVVSEDDAHGDGVNIAARLMAEAKPGAITFSRTVHDVVKGKVPMNPTYLGPRHLKHIVEPVMIWQLPAIGEEQKVAQLTAETAENLLAELKPTSEAKGTKAMIRLVAAMILIAAIPVLFFLFLKTNVEPAPAKKEAAPVASTTSGGSGSADKSKGGSPSTDPPEKGQAEPPKSEPDKAGGASPTVPEAATADALRAQLLADASTRTDFRAILDEYRFSDAVAFLRTKGYTQTPAGERLADRYLQLAAFFDWMTAGLAKIPQDNPLVVNLDGQESRVFGGLKFLVNNQPTDAQWKDLSPALIAGLARTLDERQAQAGETQDTRVSSWLRDFLLETQDHKSPGTGT